MPSKFLTVKNEAGQTPEILVYGPIGKSFWSEDGVSSQEFIDALNKFPKGTKVTIGINSQGGQVGEGLAFYNAIERRSADITCRIDGYALSAASFFPMAASRVVIPKTAILMMHEARLDSYGAKGDKLKDAEMLGIHDDVICTAYCVRTGKDEKTIQAAMKEETWMTGEEAVAYGLGDESTDGATNFTPFDVSPFKNCPENFRTVIAMAVPPISATNGGELQKTKPAASGSGATQNIMKKDTIIALLKAHGVEAKADWTDEQFETALNDLAKKPEAKAPANAAEKTAIEALQEQLKAERKTRITAEVKRRGENKIANDKIQKWVDRAMADETVLAEIDEMPVAFEAGKPISGASIEIVAEGGLEQLKRDHKTPQARRQAMVSNWKGLLADATRRDARGGNQRGDVLNVNTYSATLVTSFLIDGATTDLQNRWAMLRAFTLDVQTDPYKPLATGVYKHLVSGATAQTNATNFESGNSNVGATSVTTAQYTVSFQVSNTDLNNGLRMENLTTINTAQFANKIIEVATTPITSANFTGAATVSSAAAFGFSELASLQALLKKSPIKNLILDGSYIARIANTPGFFQTAGVIGGDTSAWRAFGWDLIAQNTDWSGAGANMQGFACHPQAILGVLGLPLTPPNIPGGILQQTTMTVPGLEIPVAIYTWFNPSSRTMWCSYDLVGGFNVLDATAGYIITSA